MRTAIDDVLGALRIATTATAAVASDLNSEHAAIGLAIANELHALFLPRVCLLLLLPREIVAAILYGLGTRDLVQFATTCRALYRTCPPNEVSVVELALLQRARDRGSSVAGPSPAAEGVPCLLRREWHHALMSRPSPLAAGDAVSVFVDSTGRLLTCGTGDDLN